MQFWDNTGVGTMFPVGKQDDCCQMAVSLFVLVLPYPGAQ